MDGKDYQESRPLAEGSDLGEIDDIDIDSLCHGKDTTKQKSLRNLYLILMIVLVVMSSICSGLLGAYFGKRTRDLDTICAAYTTQYSPLIKETRIEYSVARFNGTFMHEDIYRQTGSAEVDAAWEALGVDYRAGIISVEEGLRSGLTSAHVQRSRKYGGGYFVNVEGLHHLHCLNLIRKSLYFNFPHYKELGTHAFTNDDKILKLHVSHCLDTLRQVLMCNADTGVLGQVWYNKNEPQAFPDFKTEHKCKNFEAVRRWGEKLQEPPVSSLPPDYIATPAPDDVLAEVP